MTKDFRQGHRKRLRERFLKGGKAAVADYEILEILLFGANARQDMKPLARTLLHEFGSLSGVFNATPEELSKIKGVGDSAVSLIKVVEAAYQARLQEQIQSKPIMSTWAHVVDYCQSVMGHLAIEQLRILFLDKKHQIIKDEVQQTGTVDHTPIFPREVVKRALDLGACGLILVHNHPTGDPTPSQADIDITHQVLEAGRTLNIHLHDHLIIGKGRHVSFKSEGLI